MCNTEHWESDLLFRFQINIIHIGDDYIKGRLQNRDKMVSIIQQCFYPSPRVFQTAIFGILNCRNFECSKTTFDRRSEAEVEAEKNTLKTYKMNV